MTQQQAILHLLVVLVLQLLELIVILDLQMVLGQETLVKYNIMVVPYTFKAVVVLNITSTSEEVLMLSLIHI